MTVDHTDDSPRLEIDWLRVIAGALAAVASAILLSTLGAAGTIIGAALGSVVVTVSSAYFSQGLATSRRKLAQAQSAARDKVGIAQAEVRRAGRADDTQAQESHLDHADERLAEAHDELDAMAGGQRTGLSMLEGWRYEVFGKDALALCEGRLAFSVRNGKMVMSAIE